MRKPGKNDRARIRIGWALSLLLTVAALLPSAAVAQTRQDSVHGAGVDSGGDAFAFDATSGPNGEDATGTASADSFNVSGPVSCLDVRDNGQAVLAGISQTSSYGEPTIFTFYVVDGGTPGAGLDVLGGEFELAHGRVVDEAWCRGRPDMFNSFGEIREGEIVVNDANADESPSGKEQCKKGGWKAFHTGTARFKNQGECVAFVNRR